MSVKRKTIGNFRSDREKYYRIGLNGKAPSVGFRLKLWIYHQGFQCVAVYRLGRFAERIFKANKLIGLAPLILHRILYYLVKMIYHVDIDDATIGPGFYIGHIGTIYIGPTTIGHDFSVTHNVTIGMGYLGDEAGLPKIGNSVWVGTGSIISGPITIGNRVTVSSGSVLTKNISDGCLVAGNPARAILQNYDNIKILGWVYDDWVKEISGQAPEPPIRDIQEAS